MYMVQNRKNDFGIVSGIEEVIELIDILNKTPKKGVLFKIIF